MSIIAEIFPATSMRAKTRTRQIQKGRNKTERELVVPELKRERILRLDPHTVVVIHLTVNVSPD